MPKKRILLSALFNQNSAIDPLFIDKYVGGMGLAAVPEEGQKVLVLWGGEDISPCLYKQKASYFTRAANVRSQRDHIEELLARQCINKGIPIIGICRGAQLMCAISGGTLIQHVSGHYGDHQVMTKEGKLYTTNSIHHQMMNFEKVDHYTLIAWAHPNMSNTYIGENNKELPYAKSKEFLEPEIVWFPKTKALCIQGHPEYMSHTDPYVKYIVQLIRQYIFSETMEQTRNVEEGPA